MEELWSKDKPPTIEEIDNKLKNIPENHKQEALNDILYNVIINYTPDKDVSQVIKYLLDKGATPGGSEILEKTYPGEIFDLLLDRINNIDPHMIKIIIRKNDIETLKKLVPKIKEKIIVNENTSPEILKILENKYIIKKSEPIYLYPSYNQETNYLKLEYPVSITLDNKKWDSAERYIMYKLYEGTPKGKSILDAPSLIEAKEKFLIKPLSRPKNTKEMLAAKNIGAIANSHINKSVVKVELFYNIIYAKFDQHPLLKNMLLDTETSEIIDKNIESLGYEGNLLGNTLMRVRANFNGVKEYIISKHNQLTIKKYGTKGFYVIRGDPDDEIATKIRNLATYKTNTGMVHGKLNFNLAGGPGWLIPASKVKEAKILVNSLEPEYERIAKRGKKWIKHKLHVFLENIKNLVYIRGSDSIEAADVMFVIKDLYPCGGFLGQDYGEPNLEFIKSVKKIADMNISDAAIKILWDFLGNMVTVGFDNINTLSNFEKKIDYYNNLLVNKKVPLLEGGHGLDERETIFIEAFLKVYNLLKDMPNIKNPTVDAIKLLFLDHIKEIKEIYNEKIKDKSQTSDLDSELKIYKERFKINNPHLEIILKMLEKGPTDKKNKLLILVALEYLLKPRKPEQDLEINKKLLSLI